MKEPTLATLVSLDSSRSASPVSSTTCNSIHNFLPGTGDDQFNYRDVLSQFSEIKTSGKPLPDGPWQNGPHIPEPKKNGCWKQGHVYKSIILRVYILVGKASSPVPFSSRNGLYPFISQLIFRLFYLSFFHIPLLCWILSSNDTGPNHPPQQFKR